MSSVIQQMSVPNGEGAGAALSVATMKGRKTLQITGLIYGDVYVEASQNDVDYVPVAVTSGEGSQAAYSVPVDIIAKTFRMRRAKASAAGSLLAYVAGETLDEQETTGIPLTKYLVGTDVRAALIACIAEATALGGATITIPSRLTSYDVDNTGLGPIEIAADGICFQGESETGCCLRNISTDGAALFAFNGGANSIAKCHWKNFFIDSIVTAGHIWTFTSRGVSFSTWEDMRVRQLNPAKSIMVGFFTGSGGMFNDCFVRGLWEMAPAATVPAFDLSSDGNLITDNGWIGKQRWHCHGALAPFLKISCTAPGTWCQQNVVRDVTVEVCQRGLIYLAGCRLSTIDNLGIFDCATIDGHIIDLETDGAGRSCEQTFISKYNSVSGTLRGVNGTTVNDTSINRVGTTCTVVTVAAHNLSTGDPVYKAGATQPEYNGRFPITKIDATTYTFECTGAPATPATGAPTSAVGACDIKLGSGDSICHVIGMTGSSNRNGEVNATNRQLMFWGDNNDVVIYRENETNTIVLGVGPEAMLRTPLVKSDALAARTSGGTISNTSIMDHTVGVKVGGGDTVEVIQEYDNVFDFPDIVPGVPAELSFAAVGVKVNDRIVAEPEGGHPEAGLTWVAYGSAADEITLRMINTQLVGNINPASRNWKFTLISQ